MDEGKIVETAPSARIFTAPRYERGLADPESLPRVRRRRAGAVGRHPGAQPRAVFLPGLNSPNDLASGRRLAHTLIPVTVTEGDRLARVTVAMRGKARSQIHTSTRAAAEPPSWQRGEYRNGVAVDRAGAVSFSAIRGIGRAGRGRSRRITKTSLEGYGRERHSAAPLIPVW